MTQKDPKIPENYQTLMTYLIVKDAQRFIRFMEEIFGAKETYKQMRDEHNIRHAELSVGECTIMLADATPEFPVAVGGFFIFVKDVDKTYAEALEKGAKAVTEISDQDYGRTGGIEDPFGNTWWITSPL